MIGAARLPDYVIVGMMKSGTSSLYRWLAQQPECAPAGAKEPDFFSRDEVWARGVSWYSTMFDHAPRDKLVGEASTSYTKPFANSSVSAQRMARLLPDARLILVVREPTERLRSHYRHELRRGRERRTLVEAMAMPGNAYVTLSRYHEWLLPYIERFPESRSAWSGSKISSARARSAGQRCSVTSDCHLAGRPPPPTTSPPRNGRTAYDALALAERALPTTAYRLPRPLRCLGRAVLVRDMSEDDEQLAKSMVDVPAELTATIWRDIERLEEWLGAAEPLWDRPGALGASTKQSPGTTASEDSR